MRFFLGVHKYTPIDGMLGDMGWCKPHVHRNLGIIRFWNRMIEMDENRLTKRIFNTDYSSCHDNWCSKTLKLLQDINSSDSFYLKQTLNLTYVENTLIENFKTKWKCDIAKKTKLRTYVTFKKEFETEHYVKHCQIRTNRSIMAQFRLGILPIKIETGRFKNIPADQRFCETCTPEIENEKHVLLKCTLYEIERDTLFRKARNCNTNFDTLNEDAIFSFLMTHLWKSTNKFLVDAWHIRQNIMYV